MIFYYVSWGEGSRISAGGMAILGIIPPLFIISIIDLITILLYIFIRRPHGNLRRISYGILILMGPFFAAIILTFGVPGAISYIRGVISRIPISNETAIKYINKCNISELDKMGSNGEVRINITNDYWNSSWKDIKNGNFNMLLDAVHNMKNHCGNIEVRDYTLPSGYQLKNGMVYYNSYLLNEADYKTFIPIDDTHAKDAYHVFYKYDIVKNADPANCTPQNIAGCEWK